MKQFITLILICSCFTVEAQNITLTRKSFQSSIDSAIRQGSKRGYDSVIAYINKTFPVMRKGTFDSLDKFSPMVNDLQKQITGNNSTLKTRVDSAVSAYNITIKELTGIVNAIQGGYVTATDLNTVKALISELQSKVSTKADADLVNAIKAWMDKVKLINFQ